MPAETKSAAPALPRRAFVAAGLSALLAGAAVTLGLVGGLSTVQSQSFAFSRGTSFANGQQEALRGFLSRALADERTHVTIIGHSGTSGDASANLALSEDRAAAAEAIARALGLPASRLTVTAVGGGAPLTQQEGESDRAFQSRLARVDVSLQVRK